MGDGDTAYMNDNNRKPSYLDPNQTTHGVMRNNFNGYGMPSEYTTPKHPTIYDEKYMAKDSAGYVLDSTGVRLKYQSTSRNITADGTELGFYYKLDEYNNITSEKGIPAVAKKEKPWIDLAGQDIPYIVDMAVGRSAFTMLDKDGNIYKWSIDGSGTIAWGWDVELDIYDYYEAGLRTNKRMGLYDRYTYEVMYMRGAPIVDPVDVNVVETQGKFYKTPGSTDAVTVTVNAELPEAFVSAEMGITISSKLEEVKYVVIPYDTENPDFNIDTTIMTKADFERLAGLYTTGSILNTPIDGGLTGDTWSGSFKVTDNARVITMTVDSAYNKVNEQFSGTTIDYFYTPALIKHDGIGQYEENMIQKETNLYAATTENVVKVTSDGVSSTVYGVPLDVNGNVIVAPLYNYDGSIIT